MIDRTIAPELKSIKSIPFPAYTKTKFDNGMPVYIINAGSQEVIKIEIIFEAGRWHEPQRGVAAATSALLKEGTTKHTALEIANIIDFYGASIQTSFFIDYSSVSLYCLTKHVDALLPLFYELLTEATYAEHELNIFKQNSLQKLLVNEQKVEFVGQKKFTEVLYGNNHPIGYTTSKEDYNALTPDLLKKFRATRYASADAKMIVSGKVSDANMKSIETVLGKPFNELKPDSAKRDLVISPSAVYNEIKTDAVQSALRVGKRFINKLHPDFTVVKTANLILGEYFGSRLMSNLREEKGFCYGVYSSCASFLNDGYLCIATEVGVDVTEAALKEIEVEINRLQNELVPEEELRSARNYRLGTILGDVDGPFNSAEALRSMILFGQDENDFKRNIETLQSVTPQQIRDMAQKYFSFSSMSIVVAGKKI